MPSQNVVAIRNIITGQKLGIAKVLVKNNDIWHTNLATPNTLLSDWVLEVELNNLVVITNSLLGLDASIEVQTVSLNMKNYSRQIWH
jgi:hypothetical protein